MIARGVSGVKTILHLSIWLAAFTSQMVMAQRARLFTTDSEISNSLIYDVHQDRRGNIWIATEDGLNRYDGSKITIYKQNAKDSNAIVHNFVRLIFEDSSGQLYFGFFNGLQQYDHATDSFKEIPLFLSNHSKYAAHVLSMVERHDGTLLVGTSGHGIFELVTEPSGRLVGEQHLEWAPSPQVSLLYEDLNQSLWISTQDMGLYRTNATDSLKPFKDLGNNVSSICEDATGRLYVGSLSEGLFLWDSLQDVFHRIPGKTTGTLPVRVLQPTDHGGELLIGTDGMGMHTLDLKSQQIHNLQFNVSNFDLSKAKIHAILEDRQGNTWLGIFQKGVVLIPSQINHFHYIGYQSVKNNIIGSSYVMSLMKDRKGTLWVGTDGDGLYALRDGDPEVKHYSRSIDPLSAPNTIISVYEDSKQNMWIGGYLDGLFQLDRKTGRATPVTNILDRHGIPIQRIFSMTEDDQQNLWLGTLGYGIYSLNLETGEVKNYAGWDNPYHPSDATNKVHNSWVSSLLFSSDRKLYVGTPDGISYLDLNSNTFTFLNNLHPILWGQNIQSFHEDNQGSIWIGSSHGLWLLDPEQNLTHYTTANGLPSDVVCGIESDDNGDLWISTNYGISKMNRTTRTFINYYYHDGLQGNEFSKRASFRDKQGRIYFGGINGVTHFNPWEIKNTPKNLKVAITGFYIQDTPVKKGMHSGSYEIVKTSVMEAKVFHLAHNDNSFSIEFSAMEYVNPKRVTYLYAMKDNNWISLQPGSNTITFNDLEPGTYLFKIKARDFTTDSEVRELTVVIHPAWYLSVWAKMIYFLLASSLTAGLAWLLWQRYLNRKEMREHLHAEQIKEAKLEFFTNISHEIRTPLSLILNPLKKLISTDEDPRRQKEYGIMRRNTERILHLVNQLMDLRKIDRGKIILKFRKTDMAAFISQNCEIFEESLHAKSIDFQLNFGENLPAVWVDHNFFDKTIQNVLSNAIKFTPEHGQIHISAAVQEINSQPQLVITIADTGIGLREDERERVFDRFYQSASGQNHHAMGTGIGLHLTRSIVELHHGAIYAENNTNGPGCKFVIQLPLGNHHLDPSELEVVDTHFEPAPASAVLPVSIENQETTPVKSKTRHRVLVVDDDDEIRKYICDEMAGEYHMHACVNGKSALAYVLDKKPDLVISDVMMPEMDGITFCRKVKQNVNINHIPVILLTGKSNEKDNLEGLDIGADAYIAKPFNMEILKKTAHNILRNRELLRNNYSGNQEQSDKVKNLELQSADEKLLQRVMAVINTHLSNPDLNVEMIASEIGISRVHLYRKLKELTNQSARDLIRNIRLKQAADLLVNKNMNISEIAYATGFPNPSKFSTSFKEFYGSSPKAYLERYRQDLITPETTKGPA